MFSCTPPLPEETYCCFGEDCYDCVDLNVLENFIDLNSQGVFHHYMDVDVNGIVDPWEFGVQVWNLDNGKLISLNLNYNQNVIMDPEPDRINYRQCLDLQIIQEK